MNSAATDRPAGDMRLLADMEAPAAARDRLEAMTSDLLEERVLADAALVLSELVANASEHGTGDSVRVGVLPVGPRSVELTVQNATSAPLPPRPWEMPSPQAVRGRGLAVVSTLASEVSVHQLGDQVTVRALVDHDGR